MNFNVGPLEPMTEGPQQLPLWSHATNVAIESYPPNIPQNDVGDYLGLHVKSRKAEGVNHRGLS